MAKIESATLGGGCFWCLDAVFRELKGVTESQCGYAGGPHPNPTYEEVCEGTTGHAEVVQVKFDPAILPYEDLLGVFFSIHDPTTKDRQGNDVGTQYRSIILTHSDGQAKTARAFIERLSKEKVWRNPIVTEVQPLTRFHAAEEYHQDYFRRNPTQGYCRAIIAPKVAKFRKTYEDRLRA